MSASAPEGRPSRNTGRVEAADTSATMVVLSVSVVISHAAAASLVHMVMLAASQASHNIRKTGPCSGASAETDDIARVNPARNVTGDPRVPCMVCGGWYSVGAEE